MLHAINDPGRIVYAVRELVAEAHDPALPHRHCRSGGGRMGVGLIIAAVTIGATVATTLFAKGRAPRRGRTWPRPISTPSV